MACNTTCCTWSALYVLHMVCTRLRPDHLSVHIGESSRHNEKIAKNLKLWLSMWLLLYYYYYNQPSGKTWADHYIQVANRTLWPASTPEANWHHGRCTLRLQRSGTDSPPHPPGLSHLAETETPVMAAGWVNHQQAVGNGGRSAPHHPIPGNMWTEGLSTADRPQKRKKTCTAPPNSWQHVDWGCKHGWPTAEEEEIIITTKILSVAVDVQDGVSTYTRICGQESVRSLNTSSAYPFSL